MERIDRILRHPLFLSELSALEELERERIFCRHGLEHLLDVARLMTIYALEDNADISRDILYAAALLHDLGRAGQYRTGVPHEQGSVDLAKIILPACGYTAEETAALCAAIGAHRAAGEEDVLSRLLYRADKKSRPCYACKAAGECNWPVEKRNLTLEA